MKQELTAFVVVLSLCTVKSLLVKPFAFCVPTQVVKGPCHECICDVDGVFICRGTPCPNTMVNPRKSIKGECQPHVSYKYDELYCTCNYDGRWMSFNCREHFQYIRTGLTASKLNLRFNYTILCTPNSLFLLDCNICQCETSGVIKLTSCTNRLCTKKGHKSDRCKFGDFLRTHDEICICSDIDFYIDRLCVKVSNMTLQELKRNDIAMITNLSHLRKNMPKNTCIPFKEYRIDCNACVCDKNSELICTNKICNPKKSALRESEVNVDFYNLPSAEDEKQNCLPGQTYRIKCNTCICNDKGTLSCTTMVCMEDFAFDEGALADSIVLNH